jgi:periplasmic protein TonB
VEGKKEDVKGKDTDTKKTAPDNSKKTGANGPSEGDDKDKTGNKGKPEGTLDPNGQYSGKAGTGGPGSGGNGFGFKMAGWNWDEPPQQPKIPDNENGRIIFEIEVDANGDITKIKVVERGLSPEAVEICKEEIMKRSFVRTQGSGNPPEKSTGTITFNLKLK